MADIVWMCEREGSARLAAPVVIITNYQPVLCALVFYAVNCCNIQDNCCQKFY